MLALPAPVWQRSLDGRQHTATRGPIPPSLSSDWSYRSECQVSLSGGHRQLASALAAKAGTLVKRSQAFPDLWCHCHKSTRGHIWLLHSLASDCWSWDWFQLFYHLIIKNQLLSNDSESKLYVMKRSLSSEENRTDSLAEQTHYVITQRTKQTGQVFAHRWTVVHPRWDIYPTAFYRHPLLDHLDPECTAKSHTAKQEGWNDC